MVISRSYIESEREKKNERASERERKTSRERREILPSTCSSDARKHPALSVFHRLFRIVKLLQDGCAACPFGGVDPVFVFPGPVPDKYPAIVLLIANGRQGAGHVDHTSTH